MNDVEGCLGESLSHEVTMPTVTKINFSKFMNAEKLLDAIQKNVVIVDQQNKSMLWSSSNFKSLFPLTESATSLDDLTQIFDGLSGCLDKLLGDESNNPAHDKTFSVCYQNDQYFSLTVTLLENQHLVLCFSDIDENTRLMQRHLEDREKLLFTSRAISVSEMATIMSHELNQPIGTISNLLRGISLRIQKGEYDSAEIIAALDSAINQSLFAAN